MKKILLWICVCVSALLVAGPIEIMVGNRGFEEVKDGAPVDFTISGGTLKSSAEKRGGNYGAEYVTEVGRPLNFFCAHWKGKTPVRCGDTYTIRYYAKGSGKTGYLIPQYSGGTFRKTLFGTLEPLTPQWKLYEFKFKVTDRKINGVLPGIQVSSGGKAFIDEISVTYDPADNQNREWIKVEKKELPLPLKLTFKDGEGVLRLNGKEVKEIVLQDGYNVLEVLLTAAGADPRFAVEAPEVAANLRSAWKEIPADATNTSAVNYSDLGAPKAEIEADGFIRPRAKSGKSLFRAVILWNREYYAKESPLLLAMPEFLLPKASMQLLKMNLGNTLFPLGLRKDYRLYLEYPSWVTLMNMDQEKPRYVLNQVPDAVQELPDVTRGGVVYRRRLLTYSEAKLKPYPGNGQQPQSMIPFMVSEKAKIGQVGAIRFARSANGNFTEVVKEIPVRVCPPIRGKQPEQVKILMYLGKPCAGLSLVPQQVLTTLIQKEKAMGINIVLGAQYPKGWENMTALLQKSYDQSGIKRFFWPQNNYPIHGFFMGNDYSLELSGHAQLAKNADAQARYFGNDVQWGSNLYHHSMYCPTYMARVPEGQKLFRDTVKGAYQEVLRREPGTCGIFLDWEQEIWRRLDRKPGKGTYCFCQRCIQAFQAEAKLPKLPSEAEIKDKYGRQWEKFRSGVDAELNAMIQKICAELKLTLMYYTQTQMTAYHNHKDGAFDLLFLGYPSMSGADSSNQAAMDKFYNERIKNSSKRMIAQLFPNPHPNGHAQDGSPDGIYVQSRWKTMLLRVLATFRGGVDIGSGEFTNGGIDYYIGEATRLVADFEELFYNGKRNDSFAGAVGIAYPQLLSLENKDTRLVFLFNEGRAAETYTVTVPAGWRGSLYYAGKKLATGRKNAVTVPSEDVEVLVLRRK